MLALAFGLMAGAFSLIPASNVVAGQHETEEPADTEEPAEGSTEELKEECTEGATECCGNVKTSIIGGTICDSGGDNSSAENSTIWNLLMEVLKVMTAGVGIAAVGGIVYGALLYTTAEDKPDQTKKAISIITNVVIGLVAYGLMYVGLNFLIPGGIFN